MQLKEQKRLQQEIETKQREFLLEREQQLMQQQLKQQRLEQIELENQREQERIQQQLQKELELKQQETMLQRELMKEQQRKAQTSKLNQSSFMYQQQQPQQPPPPPIEPQQQVYTPSRRTSAGQYYAGTDMMVDEFVDDVSFSKKQKKKSPIQSFFTDLFPTKPTPRPPLQTQQQMPQPPPPPPPPSQYRPQYEQFMSENKKSRNTVYTSAMIKEKDYADMNPFALKLPSFDNFMDNLFGSRNKETVSRPPLREDYDDIYEDYDEYEEYVEYEDEQDPYYDEYYDPKTTQKLLDDALIRPLSDKGYGDNYRQEEYYESNSNKNRQDGFGSGNEYDLLSEEEKMLYYKENDDFDFEDQQGQQEKKKGKKKDPWYFFKAPGQEQKKKKRNDDDYIEYIQ